jgi:hypothetical protein
MVTDPAHPLYGLSLLLREITRKPQLGRTCIVELSPGVVRLIPVAATDLGGAPPRRPTCRVSVPALRALLTMVASWEAFSGEAPDGCGTDVAGPDIATDVSLSRAVEATITATAHAGIGEGRAGAAASGLVRPAPGDPGAGPAGVQPRAPGGAP